MKLLDDLSIYDKDLVKELLRQLKDEPNGFLEGIESAIEIYPNIPRDCKLIIFLGVGGSGIVGNMILNMLIDACKVPIVCIKGYDLPMSIMEKSFVIAVSYSGNTTETLSAMMQAYNARLPIVAITSGGLMEVLCIKLGIPYVRVKSNLLPRMAVPNMVGAAVTVLINSGLVDLEIEELKHAVKRCKSIMDLVDINVPLEKNVAKYIAYGIHDKIAFIYSSEDLSSLGYRLKCQLNENAKMLCTHNILPEALHNDIEGWRHEYKGKTAAVFIRSNFENHAVREAFEYVKDMIRNETFEVYEILCRGESRVEEVVSGMLICDYISLYAAVLRDVDPINVNRIKLIRESLRINKEIMESLRNVIGARI